LKLLNNSKLNIPNPQLIMPDGTARKLLDVSKLFDMGRSPHKILLYLQKFEFRCLILFLYKPIAFTNR